MQRFRCFIKVGVFKLSSLCQVRNSQIEAASKLSLEGDRLPEAMLKMTGI